MKSLGTSVLIKENSSGTHRRFPSSPRAPSSMSHPGEKKSEALVYVDEATDIYYSPEGDHGPDRIYHAKARLLNNAVHEIGVGKYQVSMSSALLANESYQFVIRSDGSSSSRVSDGSPTICGL